MPLITDPLQVKSFRLRNRLVMAPMVTSFAEGHRCTDAHAAWYRARAGMGLVIVESCGVDPEAAIMPGMIGIWDDDFIPGLARVADAIHAGGAPAVLQLVHGGARSVRADLGRERTGPSAVSLLPGPAPRPMTEEEILRAVERFASAARRAQAAGFDGVEVHAAHYYLLSEFLSPFTNRRTDAWGGSQEGRARLALETIRAVRKVLGPEALLLCRMHAAEFVEGGMSSEDARHFAKAFAEAGVDILNASGVGQSSLESWEGHPYLSTTSALPKSAPAGTFAPYAARLREGLGIPVIAVGKLAEKGVAQRVLDAGQADLVAVGRQLIADPETGTKLLEGRDDEILRCRECLACFASIRKGPIRCAVNRSL